MQVVIFYLLIVVVQNHLYIIITKFCVIVIYSIILHSDSTNL